MSARPSRIYLSPPHMTGRELHYVHQAFESNWLAPLGPNVDGFEREFAAYVGAAHAVALSSGTAALHLAMILSGVGPDDEVLVSTYTFCASVNPILYQGATPAFVDCDMATWGMDPRLLEQALEERTAQGRTPRAVVLVHLYGHPADVDPIRAACDRHGVALIEDAAESLGALYKGQHTGTFGRFGIYSFNGNKIMTTTGGGMLVTADAELAAHARKLATQARDPAPHYEHSEIGFNYRLSNVLAGIGRGQLTGLEASVAKRRANFERYREQLEDLPGLSFMPEAEWARHSRWLTVLLVDPERFGVDVTTLREACEAANIEARPAWKPMHRQPLYQRYSAFGGQVAERLFERGLCLPSGACLTREQQDRVVGVIRGVYEEAKAVSA